MKKTYNTPVKTAARRSWMWAALLLVVLVLGWGIPAQASCSYVPDYSTQEYRPIPTVTPGNLENDSESDANAALNPEEANSESANEGNWFQRLWRSLFG
ncbi:MAG: hypothetical protein Q6L60_14695 [Thermostichus sp. HHBFW_bins_43]